MKNLIKEYLSAVVYALSLIAIVSLSSCDKTEVSELKTERVQRMLTTSAWQLSSVTIDGSNQRDLFAGLVVTFTPSSFSAVNGDPVWPATGIWKFTDDSATEVKRGDGVIISMDISEDELVLELNWTETTLSSGRESSIAGQHVFTFSH